DVVLGYINPETYYGGQMLLNKAKAERAIREKIAGPLGIPVLEAAALIRRVVDQNMASAIKREVHLRGYYPEDFVLFAFGGAGPTHVAGFKADVPKAVIFPSSPVFCAMGASIMDIVHLYEQSRRMVFMEPITERLSIDREAFNSTVSELLAKARQEIASEGLPVDQVVFGLELDMLFGGQVNVKRMSSPVLMIESDEDAQRIYDEFELEFSQAFSPLVVNKPGGVYLDNFVLRAMIPTDKPAIPEFPLEGPDPSASRVGTRLAYWDETKEQCETAIFRFDLLRPGNVLEGPAVVEAELTTIVIPPGQRFSIDQHGFGVLENLVTAKTTRELRREMVLELS
ncbi:MAG TPA: hydantoinase/oxoprolinase family protein, partial [Stellaceae bacterium]|nr:hydantoinase/oxoprolinase family protein [Stellaceae bacterium]